MAAHGHAPPILELVHAFPTDQDTTAPEVFAQIVNDIDDDQNTSTNHGADAATSLSLVPSTTGGSGTFIPPVAPVPSATTSRGGVYVRLTLSVGAHGATIAPGLEIDDCGLCPFCLDKPKYGGPGTKRQKCELKQQEASFAAENRATRIWACLHCISGAEREQIQEITKMPLPEPLVKAIDEGPLPLVWAYRRKRRARTLPPAYVLMYYCEDRVPLDRSQLALSRQRYFKNSRSDLSIDSDKSKLRKPRIQRPRVHPVAAYPGDEHNGAAMAMVGGQMADPTWGYGQACAPMAYGQTYPQAIPGTQQPLYAAAPYMVPHPGQPMYGAAPPVSMYAQQPMYAHPQHALAPQPALMYQPDGQPVMYQPSMPPEMPHEMQQPPVPVPQGRRSKKRGPLEDDGMGGMPSPQMAHGGYYAHPADPYYGAAHTTSMVPETAPSGPPLAQSALPPAAPMPVGQMEEEANSWIADPAGEAGEYGRPSKRGKRGGASPRAPPPAPPPADPPPDDDDSSNAMSNKTLELMLSRLQGQLPPATYEKVITLVRDVQCRRMSLSRSEFLQHFQAICAGNPKPR
jgi:hypothetical protein